MARGVIKPVIRRGKQPANFSISQAAFNAIFLSLRVRIDR
jgi:hypothetical protein